MMCFPHIWEICCNFDHFVLFLTQFYLIYVHFVHISPIFAKIVPIFAKKPPIPPHIWEIGLKMVKKRTKSGQKWLKMAKFDPISKTFCKNPPKFLNILQFLTNILHLPPTSPKTFDHLPPPSPKIAPPKIAPPKIAPPKIAPLESEPPRCC